MPTDNTKDEYIRLNQDGSCELVQTSRIHKAISAALAKRFADGMSLTIKDVFTVKYGPKDSDHENIGVHVITTGKQTFCVAQLPALNLLTHWELGLGGLLTPGFLNRDHDLHGKLMYAPAVWKAPPGMRIMFCTEVQREGAYWYSSYQNSWLIAFSERKQAHLLPLPNLYDDASVCMGEFNGEEKNLQGSFEKATQQFYKAGWNADLSEDVAQPSRRLFRFEAAKEGGLVQIPPAADYKWEEDCQHIGTTVSGMIGGLL
jgi:hypothetical protein